MKIVKTTKVTPSVNPTNKYRIVADFDNEYGGESEMEIISDNETKILNIVKLYTAWKTGLDENWNKYCNCEEAIMSELAKEAGVSEDEMYDCWASNEHSWNMLEDFEVTYYDENGIEYKTKIEGEK